MQQLKWFVLVLTLAQTNARLLVLQRLRAGATLALPDELQLSSSATALTTKQAAGLDMLSKVGEADFDAAVSVLVKVLDNLLVQPNEARYRRLRTSNGKIRTLLATEGVRALLEGSTPSTSHLILSLTPTTLLATRMLRCNGKAVVR